MRTVPRYALSSAAYIAHSINRNMKHNRTGNRNSKAAAREADSRPFVERQCEDAEARERRLEQLRAEVLTIYDVKPRTQGPRKRKTRKLCAVAVVPWVKMVLPRPPSPRTPPSTQSSTNPFAVALQDNASAKVNVNVAPDERGKDGGGAAQ